MVWRSFCEPAPFFKEETEGAFHATYLRWIDTGVVSQKFILQTLDEFSDQIHDLTRKFFHHLLRHNQMAKSFQLAVDINDYDLFMDLYHSSKRFGYHDLADASLVKARSIFFDNSASSARDTPNPETSPREATFTNPSSVKRLSIAGEIPGNTGQYGRGREMRYYDDERGEFSMLPSPMQLFSTSSAVTTVHVEHPAPSDRELGNWEPLNPSNWEGQGQQIGIPEEVSNGRLLSNCQLSTVLV